MSFKPSERHYLSRFFAQDVGHFAIRAIKALYLIQAQGGIQTS